MFWGRSPAQWPSEIDPSASHSADNLRVTHGKHKGNVLGNAVAPCPILDHVGHVVVPVWIIELEVVSLVVMVNVRRVWGCRGVREDPPSFFTIFSYYFAISLLYVLLQGHKG